MLLNFNIKKILSASYKPCSIWYTTYMNKVEIRYVTNFPKMKFTAHYNGLLLSSGSNAQELGEEYAKKYNTEWVLCDNNNIYSQRGVNK